MEKGLLDYALLGAIAAEEPETMARLIERGADINCRDISGRTALHLAAEKGGLISVQTLVAAGADVNARDSNGRTPVYSAINGQDKRSVDAIIEAGADLSVKDSTGLTAEAFARQAMMYTLADEIRQLSTRAHSRNVEKHSIR